jgi:hypothetical protein
MVEGTLWELWYVRILSYGRLLLLNKNRSTKIVRWFFCSRHTIGTEKGIDWCVLVSQPPEYLEHLQHDCDAQFFPLVPDLQTIHNAYFFFTIGVMDFLCDTGVNSPQTSQNNFGELTHLQDMAKTAKQTTHMLLLILIYKSTTCKLTLSHFGSQFHWWKPKQILTVELRYVKTETLATADHRTLPRKKVNWTDKYYWNIRYNMLFYLPKALKVS